MATIHYFSSAVLPGDMADKIAVKSMAKALYYQKEKRDRVLFHFVTGRLKDMKSLRSEFPEGLELKPIYIPVLKDPNENNSFWVKLYGFFFSERILRLIIALRLLLLKRDNTKIFIRGRFCLDAMWLASKIKKIRYVFEIHNYEYGHSQFKDYIMKGLMKKASRLVTISKYTKKGWEKAGIDGDKIMILPSGVDINEFNIKESKENLRKELDLSGDKKIVLYVGSLLSWKGVDVLLRSWQHVRNTNAELVIVGGNELEIEEAQGQLDESKRNEVSFLGYKNHELVPKYLRSADLLVIPNTRKADISSFHTSPIKLFEYMASGTPVLVSNLPSIKQVVNEEYVTFFEADDEEHLASKIEDLLSNQNEHDARASSANDYVKQFSWDERAKTILSNL